MIWCPWVSDFRRLIDEVSLRAHSPTYCGRAETEIGFVSLVVLLHGRGGLKSRRLDGINLPRIPGRLDELFTFRRKVGNYEEKPTWYIVSSWRREDLLFFPFGFLTPPRVQPFFLSLSSLLSQKSKTLILALTLLSSLFPSKSTSPWSSSSRPIPFATSPPHLTSQLDSAPLSPPFLPSALPSSPLLKITRKHPIYIRALP